MDLDDSQPMATGINNLPLEVLIRIFLYLIHQGFPVQTLTQICRHWCDATVASGALWSNISDDTPSTGLWLERSPSRNSHLFLQFGSPRRTFLPVFRTVLRELTFRASASLLRAIYPNLQGEEPVLESLTITGRDPEGHHSAEALIWPRPHHIYGGVAPLLTGATFINYAIDIASPVFHGLTSLTIENPADEPSPEMLLETLRLMPLLETLVLILDWQHVDTDQLQTTPVPGSIVTLPRLSKFTFEADYDGHMYLLSRLRFTPTTSLTLTSIAFNLESLERAVRDIIRAYDKSRGDAARPCPIHRMEISEDDNDQDLFIQIHREMNDQNFVLDITLKYDRVESPDGYAMELFQLPFLKAKSTLVTTIPLSCSAWGMASNYLTNLKHLSLKRLASESFLDYLNQLYGIPTPMKVPEQDAGSEYSCDEDEESGEEEESKEEEESDEAEESDEDEESDVEVASDDHSAEDVEEKSQQEDQALPPNLMSLEIYGPDPKEHPLGGLVKVMRGQRVKFYRLHLELWGRYRPELVQPFEDLVYHFDVLSGGH